MKIKILKILEEKIALLYNIKMKGKTYEKIHHILPPIYDENSRVLILGSLPSPKSREVMMYYGNKSNRFWKTLFAIFGESAETNEQKKEFLLRRHIALWDVIESCDIVGASDASIKNAVPNDFSLITSAADIRAVFTTGKTATGLYEKFTGKKSICLPSPSGANCAVPFSALVEQYRKITEFL